MSKDDQTATGAPRPADDRTAAYAAIERRDGTPVDSTPLKQLHRKDREAAEGRMEAYLRLDRGHRP